MDSFWKRLAVIFISMMVSSMVGCLGGGGGLFPICLEFIIVSVHKPPMSIYQTLLAASALLTVVLAAGKLDGTPIRYGSLLRLKSSHTGHL